MSIVSVSFTPLPIHVRTARMVAIATARRAGIDEDLVDEIRFAVGEACARAVGINAAAEQPVVMTLDDEQSRFAVEVRDVGGEPDGTDAALDDLDPRALVAAAQPETSRDGADPAGLPDPLPAGFGLAVIAGLVEQVDVTHGPDGTRVRLVWPMGRPTD
jgi:anti-sigma regulatory factor (Ser/Thr protein kinase)